LDNFFFFKFFFFCFVEKKMAENSYGYNEKEVIFILPKREELQILHKENEVYECCPDKTEKLWIKLYGVHCFLLPNNVPHKKRFCNKVVECYLAVECLWPVEELMKNIIVSKNTCFQLLEKLAEALCVFDDWLKQPTKKNVYLETRVNNAVEKIINIRGFLLFKPEKDISDHIKNFRQKTVALDTYINTCKTDAYVHTDAEGKRTKQNYGEQGNVKRMKIEGDEDEMKDDDDENDENDENDGDYVDEGENDTDDEEDDEDEEREEKQNIDEPVQPHITSLEREIGMFEAYLRTIKRPLVWEEITKKMFEITGLFTVHTSRAAVKKCAQIIALILDKTKPDLFNLINIMCNPFMILTTQNVGHYSHYTPEFLVTNEYLEKGSKTNDEGKIETEFNTFKQKYFGISNMNLSLNSANLCLFIATVIDYYFEDFPDFNNIDDLINWQLVRIFCYYSFGSTKLRDIFGGVDITHTIDNNNIHVFQAVLEKWYVPRKMRLITQNVHLGVNILKNFYAVIFFGEQSHENFSDSKIKLLKNENDYIKNQILLDLVNFDVYYRTKYSSVVRDQNTEIELDLLGHLHNCEKMFVERVFSDKYPTQAASSNIPGLLEFLNMPKGNDTPEKIAQLIVTTAAKKLVETCKQLQNEYKEFKPSNNVLIKYKVDDIIKMALYVLHEHLDNKKRWAAVFAYLDEQLLAEITKKKRIDELQMLHNEIRGIEWVLGVSYLMKDENADPEKILKLIYLTIIAESFSTTNKKEPTQNMTSSLEIKPFDDKMDINENILASINYQKKVLPKNREKHTKFELRQINDEINEAKGIIGSHLSIIDKKVRDTMMTIPMYKERFERISEDTHGYEHKRSKQELTESTATYVENDKIDIQVHHIMEKSRLNVEEIIKNAHRWHSEEAAGAQRVNLKTVYDNLANRVFFKNQKLLQDGEKKNSKTLLFNITNTVNFPDSLFQLRKHTPSITTSKKTCFMSAFYVNYPTTRSVNEFESATTHIIYPGKCSLLGTSPIFDRRPLLVALEEFATNENKTTPQTTKKMDYVNITHTKLKAFEKAFEKVESPRAVMFDEAIRIVSGDTRNLATESTIANKYITDENVILKEYMMLKPWNGLTNKVIDLKDKALNDALSTLLDAVRIYSPSADLARVVNGYESVCLLLAAISPDAYSKTELHAEMARIELEASESQLRKKLKIEWEYLEKKTDENNFITLFLSTMKKIYTGNTEIVKKSWETYLNSKYIKQKLVAYNASEKTYENWMSAIVLAPEIRASNNDNEIKLFLQDFHSMLTIPNENSEFEKLGSNIRKNKELLRQIWNHSINQK